MGQACGRQAPGGVCAGGAAPPVVLGGQEHIQLYMVRLNFRAGLGGSPQLVPPAVGPLGSVCPLGRAAGPLGMCSPTCGASGSRGSRPGALLALPGGSCAPPRG